MPDSRLTELTEKLGVDFRCTTSMAFFFSSLFGFSVVSVFIWQCMSEESYCLPNKHKSQRLTWAGQIVEPQQRLGTSISIAASSRIGYLIWEVATTVETCHWLAGWFRRSKDATPVDIDPPRVAGLEGSRRYCQRHASCTASNPALLRFALKC